MAGPVTVTLVANTAQTATIDGCWKAVDVVPTASGQAVYVDPNGGTATVGGAGLYVSTVTEPACVPSYSTNGTTTSVSLISSTAGPVTVQACFDAD